MNKFVFVACVFVIAACNAQDRGSRSEEYKNMIEQCKTETGASDDDVNNVFKHKPMTSHEGWCLIGCIKKKIGVLDANNKIDIAKLKEQMSGMKATDPNMFKKFIGVMEECKEKVEADDKKKKILDDPCTAAQAIGTCFYSNKTTTAIP